MDVLNDIFTRFDVIADARGLEKIKTIGDAYMAVAGLPVPVADHSARAAHMALDMMDAVERYNIGNDHKLKVRIGLSTGAVVAGVIGKRKFLYDVWGDTVNTASRMESHGVTGRIQMTDSTRARLADSVRGRGARAPSRSRARARCTPGSSTAATTASRRADLRRACSSGRGITP